MLDKINYILHNIPDIEILEFYESLYKKCSKNCTPKCCTECMRMHILSYFKIYVQNHKHHGIVNAKMTAKAYSCISFFHHMERKYLL